MKHVVRSPEVTVIIILFLLLWSRISGQEAFQTGSAGIQSADSLINHEFPETATKITSDDFNQGFIISPEGLIAGHIPGLRIMRINGSPETDYAITSLRSAAINVPSSPLFIVDDVPLYNSVPDLNSEDIQSITFLNNGSADIYGGQAACGALLITTKKGTGKLRVNYTGKFAVSAVKNRFDVLDADEYRNLVSEYSGDYAGTPGFPGNADTDWQKEIFHTATGNDHHLSISGSLKNVPYRFAFGRTMMQGTIKTSSYNRSTMIVSLTPDFFNDHLRFNINARASLKRNRTADERAVYFAAVADPTLPVRNDTGIDGGYTTYDYFRNPVAMLNLTDNRQNSNRWSANIMAEYRFHFFPKLSIMANYAAENYTERLHNVTDTAASWYQYGYYMLDTVIIKNRTLNARLDYSGTFDAIDSKIDLTGGFFIYSTYYGHSYLETTITHPEYGSLADSYHTRSRISWFSRMNFSVMGKYSLSVTLNKDKYSEGDFSGDGLSGLSPSVLLAWNLKNEPFLAGCTALHDLRLFFGYGNMKSLPQSILNDRPYSSSVPVFDPRLTTERRKWHNLGIDFSVLDGRVRGNITAFGNTTADMVVEAIISSGTNFFNSILTNGGNVTCKGLEMSINASLISRPDFTWDLSLVSSIQKNVINYLGENIEFLNAGLIPGTFGYYAQREEKGYPVNSFYLMQQVYSADGRPLEGLFTDHNNDGTTDYEDRYHDHDSNPAATIGITSALDWKNWEFSFSGRADIGNYLYNFENLNANYQTVMVYHRNVSPLIKDSQFGSSFYLSDYFVENASFFRMDYISLGYKFKKLVDNKLSLRLSATVENAFILTGYSGNDPEVQSGISYYTWPRPITALLAVSIGF